MGQRGPMSEKNGMFLDGVSLMESFCALNGIAAPTIERLNPAQRNYHIGTCAYYRPTTIHIMVEKCAGKGFSGRAWSWPGYAIDRTPYGVIQHELGHHVDFVRSGTELFSKQIWEESREAPLTGYLGTDKMERTFWMEWFAENFRLFVTNPGLSERLRPRFHAAIIRAGIKPLGCDDWEYVLAFNSAPPRIIEQARKKIGKQDEHACLPGVQA